VMPSHHRPAGLKRAPLPMPVALELHFLCDAAFARPYMTRAGKRFLQSFMESNARQI